MRAQEGEKCHRIVLCTHARLPRARERCGRVLYRDFSPNVWLIRLEKFGVALPRCTRAAGSVSTLPLLPMGTTGEHWGLLEGLILVRFPASITHINARLSNYVIPHISHCSMVYEKRKTRTQSEESNES